MEFRNLTPFSVMNYKMLDTDDKEHHVIVMKVGYELVSDGNNGDYTPHLLMDLALVSEDQFTGDLNTSSVLTESDLAPFKPRCDVLINGIAYAPDDDPAESIVVSLLMTDRHQRVLIEKSLRCFGERQFVLDENSGEWQLTVLAAVRQLPVDYRYAFGGECKIYANDTLSRPVAEEVLLSDIRRAAHPEKESAPVAHSTEEHNPLGQGFITSWYQQSLNVTAFAAPQIESPEYPVTTGWVVSQLNDEQLPHGIAGFGAIGRAWLPRRLLAGTYDETWLNQRHPYLPHDFDFGYWNCAPEDQQIAYPAGDFSLILTNLTSGGIVRTTLPGHRPFVLLRMAEGQLIPLKLNPDTIVIDTEKLQLFLTYRLVFEADLPVRVCEARFETDPAAPLVRFAEPQKELTHG